MKDEKELLKKIGYEFRDDSLLRNALTHSSYSSEHRMNYALNNDVARITANVDICLGTVATKFYATKFFNGVMPFLL